MNRPLPDSATRLHEATLLLLQGAAELSQIKSPRDPAERPIILLVDDDPAVLVSLARVLMSEGWNVITATNGTEALERLNEHQPDLMITDLSMGAVSGWDLLFHENMQRPTLPIFVITAHPPALVGGADRFASAFFQKPLDLDQLVAAIRRRFASGASAAPRKTAGANRFLRG
jgi:two-component system, OmpR family, response regulator MprA